MTQTTTKLALRSLLPVLSVLFTACAGHISPSAQSVSGSEVIRAGESGFLRWTFEYTDNVKVSGVPGLFLPTDIVYVSPMTTTTYGITGYREGDSATVYFTMQVVSSDTAGRQTAPVETGGAVESEQEQHGPALQESSTPSVYYAGKTTTGDRPEQLKIMRVLPAATGRPPVFHAVVLDQYGNMLGGRTAVFGTIKSNCVGSFTTLTMTADVKEISELERPPVSITLCADYSQPVLADVPTLESAYRQFFESFAPQDELSMIPFDHRSQPLFQQVSPDRAIATLMGGVPQLGGLTGVYKAAFTGLRTLKKSSLRQRALVLLTSGSENSSLSYTINDIAIQAREMQIPVYTIAVGMNPETYSLRYLADYTGGRFYKIAQPSQVSEVLQEIANSYRSYYDVSFNPGSTGLQEIAACPGTVYTTLALSDGMEMVREMRAWNTEPQQYYPYHQIVATFGPDSAAVPSLYDSQLDVLATLLKDNPGQSIELIGYTQPEDNEQLAESSSLKRAQIVRDALVERGVNVLQARIRGAGSTMPMYYFAQQDWQRNLNRRVEVRWLDPTLLPFEILAQTVYTEQEAERLIGEWEKRGQKAYYELIISKQTPAFRIKLWGYATYDSALSAKTDLQRKYKIPLSVQ
jgi:hypothetical protein